MKNQTHVMLNTLLAILSIVFLIIGISEGIWLLTILGVICFFVILFLRGRQIRKMNRELENMHEEIPDETDDLENE
ncbi:MAG: hypothetical protein K9N05_07560 [Candidatus Marinimicrobia bacterium]|nr:hypothetical protein [Candidatus Neomarinimicrobiota bacterium]